MAVSPTTDLSRQLNEGGLDAFYNNGRTRNSTIATGFVVTPTTTNGTMYIEGAGTPASYAPAGATTINYYDILTGIITYKPSGAFTFTFDTAENMLKACNLISAGVSVGDYVTCLIINAGTGGIMTMAAGAGNTFDTNAGTTVPVNSSRVVYYRFTNVTAGSAAAIIYW
jgi:hypothetical protein